MPSVQVQQAQAPATVLHHQGRQQWTEEALQEEILSAIHTSTLAHNCSLAVHYLSAELFATDSLLLCSVSCLVDRRRLSAPFVSSDHQPHVC